MGGWAPPRGAGGGGLHSDAEQTGPLFSAESVLAPPTSSPVGGSGNGAYDGQRRLKVRRLETDSQLADSVDATKGHDLS